MTIELGVDIEIKTTAEQMRKMALQAMREFLNDHLPKVAIEATQTLQGSLQPIFMNTEVYRSMVQGPLDAHFGIPKGEAESRLNSIIQTLADSLRIDFTRVSVRGNGNLGGGLVVRAINADFSDIMALPAAKVQTAKREDLPWLEWLLTLGDAIIIKHYDIRFGSYNSPPSRSGQAIMVAGKSRGWKVPIGVSGTLGNNWITRAVLTARDEIEKIIDQALQDAMEKVF